MIRACPIALTAIVERKLYPLEARLSGHHFLDRLIAEWRSGTNRFDNPGECLIGLFDSERPVAFGGLSRDPFDTRGRAAGRLRQQSTKAGTSFLRRAL